MREMPDLSFSAVCKGQYQAGYEAAMKDFFATMQYLRGLSAKPSLSDRQYLEKIADRVIARSQPKVGNTESVPSLPSGLSSLATCEADENVASISKAETSLHPAVETAEAQSGADASKVVCPALIDDVGGQ